MQDPDKFYKKLKNSLEETTSFPSKYLYKFILPANQSKEKEIENIFNFAGAVINTTPSKTGKYKSISILVLMQSADAVIEKYKAVAKIEGVISL